MQDVRDKTHCSPTAKDSVVAKVTALSTNFVRSKWTSWRFRKEVKLTDRNLVTSSRKHPASVGKKQRSIMHGKITSCAPWFYIHCFFHLYEIPTVAKMVAEL